MTTATFSNNLPMEYERAWRNRMSADHLLRGLGKPTSFARRMAAAKYALADRIETHCRNVEAARRLNRS